MIGSERLVWARAMGNLANHQCCGTCRHHRAAQARCTILRDHNGHLHVCTERDGRDCLSWLPEAR